MKKNPYRIIGVDFDGTLAHTKGIYPNIGEPNRSNRLHFRRTKEWSL